MKNILVALLIAVSCPGCGAAIAAIVLSDGDAEELVDNFGETIETQQQLSQYAMKAARGDLDIDGYAYDPPTAENGMTGTLTMNGGQLPFGDGNIVVTFQVDGDGAAVDPYATDLSGMGQVDGVVQIHFVGTSPEGKPLDIDADVDVTTLSNSSTDVTALMTGVWDIDLDGYRTNFSTDGLELDIDLVSDEVTRAEGSIDGDIDIPDFPVDGDFDIEGLGDKFAVAVDVAVTRIDFDVQLSDLF